MPQPNVQGYGHIDMLYPSCVKKSDPFHDHQSHNYSGQLTMEHSSGS